MTAAEIPSKLPITPGTFPGKTVEFKYKGWPAWVGAEEVDGRWIVTVGMTPWGDMNRRSELLFDTHELALDKGAALIRSVIDQTEWKQDFQDRWDDLVFGWSDWKFEELDQDWATVEWRTRECRSGDETAVIRFNEMSAEEKAKYFPGGAAFRADWVKKFDRPSSGAVPVQR